MAPQTNISALIAFDTLYIIGLLSLSTIFMTAILSYHVRRQLTWYMVIASWVLNSVSNLLLIGRQTKASSNINHGLCLTQAILIDSTTVLCGFCATMFALEVYVSILLALRHSSGMIPRIYSATMMAVPWLAFVGTVAITATNGLMHGGVIEKYPAGFFCWNAVPNDWRKYLIGGSVGIGILGAIIVEALILVEIRRRWHAIAESASIRRHKTYITIDSIVRMIVFSAAIVIALGLTFLQYLTSPTLNEDTALGIVQATLPCFAALVFGSQRDILGVWINAVKICLGRNETPSNMVPMRRLTALDESNEGLNIDNISFDTDAVDIPVN